MHAGHIQRNHTYKFITRHDHQKEFMMEKPSMGWPTKQAHNGAQQTCEWQHP